MLIVVLVLFVIVVWYALTYNTYWKKKNIPYIKGVPILGTVARSFLGFSAGVDDFDKSYRAYPNEKIIGSFSIFKPFLLLRDPGVIKQITVKDFEYFMDHTPFLFQKEVDPILSKNLFALTGKRWKEMRSTLSPVFTSSKMKMMFELVSSCGYQMAAHYRERLQIGNDMIELEMKDTFTRFTNDVIATTAFGFECDSFKDPNNVFFEMGKRMTDLKLIRILLIVIVPKLMKFLGQGMMDKDVFNFFSELIMDAIKYRDDNNIIRPDLIHLLMEARKGKLEKDEEKHDETNKLLFNENDSTFSYSTHKKADLSDEEILAQAAIFFFAGFDTASTLLAFAAHELTLNVDVQQKLQCEIDETLEKCNGKITYDALLAMQYLDMVILETFRKWPPTFASERICTNDYILKTGDHDLFIEKGMAVMFPIFSFHRDPKYYPSPDKFIPERFGRDKEIKPYTFLPFGVGPRMCIGSRFALMESKLALFYLLANFNFVVIKKTNLSSTLQKSAMKICINGGFWLGLELRNK